MANRRGLYPLILILKGQDTLPTGFLGWGNSRAHGRYVVVGGKTSAGLRWWRKDGDCSHIPDGRFTTACKTHDLGYDLLRFFEIGGDTRRAVDHLLKDDMYAYCDSYSGVLAAVGVACRRTADGVAFGVNKNTTNQHEDVP